MRLAALVADAQRIPVRDHGSAPADWPVGPFHLTGRQPGCLLIHGFTATPWEMRFLGERLHASGHTVRGIQLAGHGASPADLERSTWRDWYDTARRGLQELPTDAPTVVVGQSMGALLALQLAVHQPQRIAGVALLSPALRLSRRWLHWTRPLFPLLRLVLPQRLRHIPKGDSDIADAEARAASPSHRTVPLRAVHELLLLQQRVRRTLPRVTQPILIVHARQDHTCPLVNVDLVRRAVLGPVELHLLDASYHVISVDVERHAVAARVTAFAARTLGRAG